MFDIQNAFQTAFTEQAKPQSTKKADGESYPYATFDACNKYNRGTLVGRMIPDAKGIPFRVIDNCLEMKIPYTEQLEGGKTRESRHYIRWADDKNYVAREDDPSRGWVKGKSILTPEQRALNKELLQVITSLNQLKKEEIKSYGYNKLAVFFMKIYRTVPGDPKQAKTYTNPGLTIVTHKSANFGKALQTAYTARSNTYGNNDWVPKVFNRNPDPIEKMVSVNTKLKQGDGFGYEVAVSFEDLAPLALTEEDLKKSENIFNAFIDVTSFNEEQVKNCINIIRERLAAYGGIATTTTTVTDQRPQTEGAGTDQFTSAPTTEGGEAKVF